jgi:two-component system cell cycle sensor histidine kinase/response regulator CckA
MEAVTPSCNETLLIVDDEPLMTDVFRQYMSRRGYYVLTADSGQKALQTMADDDGHIKLIITDLTMPDIDGAELARLLQRSAPSIPVLIATGHDLDLATSDLPTNVVEVIRKPYQNRLLAMRIREILDERRQ